MCGLPLAIALNRSGIDVQVFESAVNRFAPEIHSTLTKLSHHRTKRPSWGQALPAVGSLFCHNPSVLTTRVLLYRLERAQGIAAHGPL